MNTSTTPGERSALAFEREYLAWYTRVNDEVGTAFDPSALVALARAQYPHLPQVADAFGRLTAIWHHTALYSHFLSYGTRTAHWRFLCSFPLQHPLLGRLQVDLVHDPQHAGRPAIGGVEYLDRVLGRLPHDDGRTTLVHLCRKHARA